MYLGTANFKKCCLKDGSGMILFKTGQNLLTLPGLVSPVMI